MIISFSPQRYDGLLTLEKVSGDCLRINGELFNFGPLPDGGNGGAGGTTSVGSLISAVGGGGGGASLVGDTVMVSLVATGRWF